LNQANLPTLRFVGELEPGRQRRMSHAFIR